MDMTALSHVSVRPNTNAYEFVSLSDRDHLFRQMSYSGEFYEAALLKAVSPFLAPGEFVVDVGANIGTHSVFWAGENLCKVLSFEPVKVSYDLLVENVRRNGLEHVVFPRNFGIGSLDTSAMIGDIDDGNLGATKIVIGGSGQIAVRKLDNLPEIRSNKVCLIKIDVEGMEIDVLEGATEMIERDRPIIVCECQDDDSLSTVSGVLAEYGYDLLERFNSTPTYLFVESGWWTRGRYPWDIYASQRSARRHSAVPNRVIG